MTPDRGETPVEIVGVDGAGRTRVRLPLGHGEDPVGVLAANGFASAAVRGAVRDPGRAHVLTFTFDVVAAPEGSRPAVDTPRALSPRWDVGLVLEPGEAPRRLQRVAAYAVVTSVRGILLTEFSDRTNAPGRWGLPGGGLDPGEAPDEAVLREIWEETGQRVSGITLVRLQSSHWVGRAPRGILEDFHALRVIYTADCRKPVDPVVHDIGGTTSDARWVMPEGLLDLPLTEPWRATLEDVVGESGARSVLATDETDDPDNQEDRPRRHDDAGSGGRPVDDESGCLPGDGERGYRDADQPQ